VEVTRRRRGITYDLRPSSPHGWRFTELDQEAGVILAALSTGVEVYRVGL